MIYVFLVMKDIILKSMIHLIKIHLLIAIKIQMDFILKIIYISLVIKDVKNVLEKEQKLIIVALNVILNFPLLMTQNIKIIAIKIVIIIIILILLMNLYVLKIKNVLRYLINSLKINKNVLIIVQMMIIINMN